MNPSSAERSADLADRETLVGRHPADRLFTLLGAGAASFWLTIPISVLIVTILGIIVVSYRQTIRAYPNGGGSSIVAKANLGVVPASGVTRDVVQAIRFGRTMSDDVTAVHLTDDLEAGERLRARFEQQLPGVPLIIVESPYRSLVRPLVRFLEAAAERSSDDVVVVLLPEYLSRHWWERFLYNESGRRIRRDLLGRPNILIAEVPYRRET